MTMTNVEKHVSFADLHKSYSVEISGNRNLVVKLVPQIQLNLQLSIVLVYPQNNLTCVIQIYR